MIVLQIAKKRFRIRNRGSELEAVFLVQSNGWCLCTGGGKHKLLELLILCEFDQFVEQFLSNSHSSTGW